MYNAMTKYKLYTRGEIIISSLNGQIIIKKNHKVDDKIISQCKYIVHRYAYCMHVCQQNTGNYLQLI